MKKKKKKTKTGNAANRTSKHSGDQSSWIPADDGFRFWERMRKKKNQVKKKDKIPRFGSTLGGFFHLTPWWRCCKGFESEERKRGMKEDEVTNKK